MKGRLLKLTTGGIWLEGDVNLEKETISTYSRRIPNPKNPYRLKVRFPEGWYWARVKLTNKPQVGKNREFIYKLVYI